MDSVLLIKATVSLYNETTVDVKISLIFTHLLNCLIILRLLLAAGFFLYACFRHRKNGIHTDHRIRKRVLNLPDLRLIFFNKSIDVGIIHLQIIAAKLHNDSRRFHRDDFFDQLINPVDRSSTLINNRSCIQYPIHIQSEKESPTTRTPSKAFLSVALSSSTTPY